MTVIFEVPLFAALAGHPDLCGEACFGIWRRAPPQKNELLSYLAQLTSPPIIPTLTATAATHLKGESDW